jgi:hypothetical protein
VEALEGKDADLHRLKGFEAATRLGFLAWESSETCWCISVAADKAWLLLGMSFK